MQKILKFFVRFFALIGFAVVLVSALGWTAFFLREKPKLPDEMVVSIDLTKPVKEKAKEGPLDFALDGGEAMELNDVVTAIDLARRDDRVKVVLASFREDSFSLAAAQEIRSAMQRLRESGKLSYAFATSFGEFGPANNAYYTAAAFDEIWVQPGGLIGYSGLASQMPFFAGTLDKIGLKAEFLHREEYKTAMEMLTEKDFTAANAEMIESILDDTSSQMAEDVAADRGLLPLEIFRLIDAAPLTAKDAVAASLIDHIGFRDAIEDKLLDAFGEGLKTVGARDYLQMRRAEQNRAHKKETVPTVALIHLTGQVVQGDSGLAGKTGDMLSADEAVRAIRDAVSDDTVEAILLRLDSPGGSAVASESIRHALARAQGAGLPVVVSMGSMAGSGGYWIAQQADAIFADPATLTGSIGVLAGKVSGTDTLWEKLGINWGLITRGENADMWTVTAPYTEAQKKKVDALVGDIYVDFKQKVAEARELAPEEVDKIARGRVWTGRQALDLGLVDQLGGFRDAILYSKSLIGLGEEQLVTLQSFPAPKDVRQRILKLIDRLDGMGVSLQGVDRLLGAAASVMEPLLAMAQGPSLQMPFIGAAP